MGKPVFNTGDAVYVRELKHGDRFEARLAPIANQLGAKKPAYNLTEVAPGKRAFPFHNHHSNEEFFFVTAGEGTFRFGDDEFPVRPGDIIAGGSPRGGPSPEIGLRKVGRESRQTRPGGVQLPPSR